MGTFLAACILLGALTISVNGQQSTCSAPSNYFTMAATRLANQPNPNQYYIIGGMFDVHDKGTTAYDCASTISDDTGFINMLAFFWGINKFFSGGSVSVGAVAFDNCNRTEQTIQNMFDFAQCRININDMQRENLVAYVGPYMNEDVERAGDLAADLGITVFSPMADSMNLNIMDQRTLLKMRPSFAYDLKAIVAFLNRVNASLFIVIYSGSDPYWKDAYDTLSSQIKNSTAGGVAPCIQYAADYDAEQSGTILDRLSNSVKVKYIVPLLPRTKLDQLMSQMYSYDRSFSSFIFILTSRIGRDLPLLRKQSAIANHTIIIDVTVSDVFITSALNEFNSFLINLNENNTIPGLNDGAGNRWIQTYTANRRPPLLTTSSEVASPLRLSVYETLLSVSSIIKGMGSVISKCGTSSNNQFCDQYRNQPGKVNALYQEFKAASNLHMSDSGDLKYSSIKYTYYMFIVNNDLVNSLSFQEIGTMSVSDTGVVNANINELRDTRLYGIAFSEPACPDPGQGQCCEIITTTPATSTATMPSVTSPSGAAQGPTLNYSIVYYPYGQVITGAYANGSRMDSEYGTRFDLGQKWIIALGVLAGLGILCVIVFEIYILYKLLGTPTGSKWRTMWLGQLLLFGIFLCYLVLFAYLPTPTKATCGITRFGVGVSYAFCFAVLLVKLMVILTSKPSNVLLPGDVETPNYLKGTYQFLMFIFAVGVQVVIDVQWLITVPPEAVKVTANNGVKVWVCNHYTFEAGSMDKMTSFVRTEFENHIMSLIYVMVLILITTVLSLKSHGIITNHRESIFVGIAAGFTIPIWLAWGLVGGLNKNHDYAQEFGDGCIAFGLLITASLILFAMFLPKVRHLVNMGVEGIYLEDDRETIYGGSVILAPSSYKSKGSGSVIYVNNQGIYSEPVVIGNGDPMATHLKHPGSVYSVPATTYMKHPESTFGGSTRVLRVTDDLRGRHLQKRSQSEVAYGASRRPRSHKGTLPRSRSQTNLGAL